MNTTTTSAPSRPGAAARALLPLRQAPTLHMTPRQPLRVLQSGRAPAQLSLCLRPGLIAR